MTLDIEILNAFYSTFAGRVNEARRRMNRPVTLTEKIFHAHMCDSYGLKHLRRGEDYVNFRPDRVIMQDATAQMAILQFMNAGKKRVATPTSVHCDHLITAERGAKSDLEEAKRVNREVYDFLMSASSGYGIDFWMPGAGIIHQVALENYAFPGGMMIGTDSHTPNAGGLGMLAVGVGGADAVDVMSGMEWELKMPRLTGVRLTGRLGGWASPKDVILKLAGMLTVKGATNTVIEYFGDGAASLSATGKATICNMGAETGATSSIFPFDESMATYLRSTGREDVAAMACRAATSLRADDEVMAEPERYYDRLIEINLTTLEPYVNGPFTPDAATPISQFAATVRENAYPRRMEAGLIGSCTNSSYRDISRVASIARQAVRDNIEVASPLIVNPGSEQIRYTALRDGLIGDLKKAGAIVTANACGPCIGQWKRRLGDNTRRNSIVTSFNRNFAGRADGNPNTHAFVASPEIVMAMTIAGDLCFNPLTDKLRTVDGREVALDEPEGDDFPLNGFEVKDKGYVAPGSVPADVHINPDSKRLQLLRPFPAADNACLHGMYLLVKVAGKCTTDHISMAGQWLRFRGHLENISDNLLMGAVNAFNGKVNMAINRDTGIYGSISSVAGDYRRRGISSVIVAGDNYGEGSSREHAAMEPRYMNVKLILAKSFARIHETNLKKQGMLALTFADKNDYDKVREDDTIDVQGADNLAPGKSLNLILRHAGGEVDVLHVNHSYNELQIKWYMAGSALNHIKANT
ncbi:MAG: aconitate hydratase [Tannerellaceae bacterium]|jgi:aconitate hydratase|nr:aconitate hydratase [Tannerellaceae bacterium]